MMNSKIVITISTLLLLPMTSLGSSNHRVLLNQKLSEMTQVYRSLQASETVINIERELNKIIDETVIERNRSQSADEEEGFAEIFGYDRSWAYGDWWSWGYGSSSFSFGIPYVSRSTSKSSWDVTKMIARNPKEISEFPEEVQVTLKSTQRKLIEYIDSRKDQLIELKLLAIETSLLASQSIENGSYVAEAELEAIRKMAFDLNFIGKVNITTCTTTNYARKVNRSSDRGSVGFGAFFMLPGPASYEVKIQKKHQVKTCESTVNRLQVNPSDSLFLVSLSALDYEVSEAITLAYTKLIYKQQRAPAFPTWGSPYYKSINTEGKK